jgi:hypothetical protein
MKTLKNIQHNTLYQIAGAFKTTSRAALEVCLPMPPPQITMKRATEDSCLRIILSSFYQILQEIQDKYLTTRRNPEQDPALSPLERLERCLTQDLGKDADQPLNIKTIKLIITTS